SSRAFEQVRKGIRAAARQRGHLSGSAQAMTSPFSRLSLLWKILLSTSVAVTVLFAITGQIVLHDMTKTMADSLEEEVQGSFKAYNSLWLSRAEALSSVSRVISSMSDVRAAFLTRDRATIRD